VNANKEAVALALQTRVCVVTAANQAEIIAKSLDRGLAAEAAQAILAELPYTVIDILARDGAQA
jgi:ribonuclease VapC